MKYCLNVRKTETKTTSILLVQQEILWFMSILHTCIQTNVLYAKYNRSMEHFETPEHSSSSQFRFFIQLYTETEQAYSDIWHEVEVRGPDDQAVNKPISGAEERDMMTLHHERHEIMYSNTADRSCATAYQQHWEELKSWNKEWDTTMVTDAPQSRQCQQRGPQGKGQCV